MAEERHPIEDVLEIVDGVRGVFGGAMILAIAIAIAFLVLGNTAGRLIGVALLAIVVIPVLRAARKRSAKRS